MDLPLESQERHTAFNLYTISATLQEPQNVTGPSPGAQDTWQNRHQCEAVGRYHLSDSLTHTLWSKIGILCPYCHHRIILTLSPSLFAYFHPSVCLGGKLCWRYCLFHRYWANTRTMQAHDTRQAQFHASVPSSSTIWRPLEGIHNLTLCVLYFTRSATLL